MRERIGTSHVLRGPQGVTYCPREACSGPLTGLLAFQIPLDSSLPERSYSEERDPASELILVAIRLVHAGHASARKRAVHRIAGTLAFEDSRELFVVLLEP